MPRLPPSLGAWAMTNERFDAYYKWLGIPPEEQPPHFYRLLGIRLYESDLEVISHAADRQMTHVRSMQRSVNSKASQDLLNEISAAKLCLLTEDKKHEYDLQLQSKLQVSAPLPPTPPPPPPPPSQVQMPPAVAAPPAANLGNGDLPFAPLPLDEQLQQAPTPAAGSLPSGPLSPAARPDAFSGGAPQAAGPQDASLASFLNENTSSTAQATLERPVAARAHVEGEKSKQAKEKSSWIFWATGLASTVSLGCLVLVVSLYFMRAGEAERRAQQDKLLAAASEEAAPEDASPGEDDPSESIVNLPPMPGGTDLLPGVAAAFEPPPPQPVEEGLEPGTRLEVDLDGDVIVAKIPEPVKLPEHKQWNYEGGSLISPGGLKAEYARYHIPADMPEEYMLGLIVSRERGYGQLAVGLPVGGSRCAITLDGRNRPKVSGIGRISGQAYYQNQTMFEGELFRNGQGHSILCRVRKDRISVSVDGRQIIYWEGDADRLRMPYYWNVPEKTGISVGTHRSSYRISRIVVVPLRPDDEVLPAEGVTPRTPDEAEAQ